MDFLKSLLLKEARMKDAAMDLVYQAAEGTPTISDNEKYLMKVVAKVLSLDKDKLFKGDAVAAEKMVKSVLGADKVKEATGDEKFDSMLNKIVGDTPKAQEPTEKDIGVLVASLDKDARGAAKHLDNAARFKTWDADMGNKVLYWVTQDTPSDEAKKKAAEAIASMMHMRGYTGWTVKVTIRDDYNGERDDRSNWQSAES